MTVLVNTFSTIHPARAPGATRDPSPPRTCGDPARRAPRAAPDGGALAVVTTYDLEKNEGRGRIWLCRPRAGARAASRGRSPPPSVEQRAGLLARRQARRVRAQGATRPRSRSSTSCRSTAARPRSSPTCRSACSIRAGSPTASGIAFLAPLIAGHLTLEATKAAHRGARQGPGQGARHRGPRVPLLGHAGSTTGEVPHLFVLDLETRELTRPHARLDALVRLHGSRGPVRHQPRRRRDRVLARTSSEPPHRLVRWALFTVPTAGGEPTCLTPDNPADDLRPRYSPDGAAIVYGMQHDPYFYADRVRLDALRPRTARTHTVLTEAGTARRRAGSSTTRRHARVRRRGSRRARALFALALERRRRRRARCRGRRGAGARGRAAAGSWFTRQTLSEPAEVWTATRDGGSARRRSRASPTTALDGHRARRGAGDASSRAPAARRCRCSSCCRPASTRRRSTRWCR